MELPFRAARLQVSFGAAAARPEPRTRAALSARFLRAVAAAAAAAAAAGRRGGGGGGGGCSTAPDCPHGTAICPGPAVQQRPVVASHSILASHASTPTPTPTPTPNPHATLRRCLRQRRRRT